VIYADSGSSDGSADAARTLGVPVVELDPGAPFSAGRGRNEGLDEALRRWPELKYVMFLDGDCILHPDFPERALATFEAQPDCAIVVGHLSERFPERSIYNRLCAIEWRSPPGVMTNMNHLGGIMAVRISSFRSAGGFNLDAIAGEEPDLGARLLAAGQSIIKIDAPMASHDADMLTFRQWWKRAVRGGHALAYRWLRSGRTGPARESREILSDLFWAVGLPAAILLLFWPTRGLSLLLFAAYPLFAGRVYRHYRSTGLDAPDAMLATRFIVYGKFAHVVGFATFARNWIRGEFRIIEYK
jgi:GT2 family glycosyltransferase